MSRTFLKYRHFGLCLKKFAFFSFQNETFIRFLHTSHLRILLSLFTLLFYLHFLQSRPFTCKCKCNSNKHYMGASARITLVSRSVQTTMLLFMYHRMDKKLTRVNILSNENDKQSNAKFPNMHEIDYTSTNKYTSTRTQTGGMHFVRVNFVRLL